MKNVFKLPNIIVVFFLLLILSSCTNNEVEPLFEQTIKERTDALKNKYHNILTAPENGWIGYYSPNSNYGNYTMLMNFNKDGSISIKSDYGVGDLDNTITYRLDKTLKIELVLESHTVFSDIFEIGNNNNGGEFVFNILEATQDKIVLESKLDSGDDITIFTLKKASDMDLLDLPLTIASVTNLINDGTNSVFRNVLLNDEVIAAFDFNPTNRVVAIIYIEDGDIVTKTEPIVVSATGFFFIKPLEINGTVLTSFTFDEATNEYVNTENNLKIIYDNVPAPGILDPYDFKKRYNRAGYNTDEPEKSSLAFRTFLTEFSSINNLTISWIGLYELSSTDLPYIFIITSAGRFWWVFNYDIIDGKVYFTPTGEVARSVTPAIDEAFKPLLNILIGSELGYYTSKTGGLLNFTNRTFAMINASNPRYLINYWGF